MNHRLTALVLGVVAIVFLGGCAVSPAALSADPMANVEVASKPITRPPAATKMIRTGVAAPEDLPPTAPQEDAPPEDAPPVVPSEDLPPEALPAPAATPVPYTPASPSRVYWRRGYRGWSGCGIPCEAGCRTWHARLLGGIAFHAGDDAGSKCLYLGADLGTTFCRCWGVDVFYRTHEAQFDRLLPGDPAAPRSGRVGKDGGRWHHVGAKLTYERSISRSRWFGYAGLGVQYFWTEKYLDNDNGFGGFGELGIGYAFNHRWRLRAGVEVFGQDTSVTRENPANDGQSRLLWVISPVIQVEIDF